MSPAVDAPRGGARVRFGITSDAHLMAGRCPELVENVRRFLDDMRRWRPDFIIDTGDFACQAGDKPTTPALHDEQLKWLRRHWAMFADVPFPACIVLGNHDVGFINGADECITCQDLYAAPHMGEDVTKDEWLAVTGMPGRYYSFDAGGVHFIVLDGNNPRGPTAVPMGRDGTPGGYWIDDAQKAWLAADLAAHRDRLKVVFTHEPVQWTPPQGSGQGGDVPYSQTGKCGSYIDNGWEVREMLSRDGRVAVVFESHKHDDRWVVYGGVHYVSLRATHAAGSYAKVTISDRLYVGGFADQRSYTLPLPAWKQGDRYLISPK